MSAVNDDPSRRLSENVVRVRATQTGLAKTQSQLPVRIECRIQLQRLRKVIGRRALREDDSSWRAWNFNEPCVAEIGDERQLHVVLESNFPVLYFEYVRMGMGVALTPLPPESRLRTQLRQSGVALRSAEHLFGGEPIYYVRRKGQFETPYATKFRELVVAQHGQTVQVKS